MLPPNQNLNPNVPTDDRVNKKQRKLLALDGGPSALVIIRLIAKIEEARSGFLDHVDLFAGTSFGGLLSLDLANSLTQGKNSAQAIKDCVKFSDKVVNTFEVHTINVLRLLSGYWSMSDGKALRTLLDEHFKNEKGERLRMKDLKKQVTLVGFDSFKQEMTTYHPFNWGADPSMTLAGAGLACASVPLVGPAFRGVKKPSAPPGQAKEDPRSDHLILDGGLGSNSVAMAALTDALLNMSFVNEENRMADFIPYITLLSMGGRPTDQAWPGGDLNKNYEKALAWIDKCLLPSFLSRIQEDEDLGTTSQFGWGWLLRQNVVALLTLFGNTVTIDDRYASNLLDWKRYKRVNIDMRMIPQLGRIMWKPRLASDKADKLANEHWLKSQGELLRWVDEFWMNDYDPKDPGVRARVTLDWAPQPDAGTPFVSGDRVYFRGPTTRIVSIHLHDKKWIDLGTDCAKSAPCVDGEYVYFQGIDNRLMWLKTDGTESGQLGTLMTKSAPFVESGYVFFRALDDTFWRARLDGSEATQLGSERIGLSPWGAEGHVYIQKKNDQTLWRLRADGTGWQDLGQRTKSTPCVSAEHVYFQRASDDTLWRMKTDATDLQLVCSEEALSGPVFSREYVYFQARDQTLCRVPCAGGKTEKLSALRTKSRPFAATDGCVYFKGTDNLIWRLDANDVTRLSIPKK